MNAVGSISTLGLWHKSANVTKSNNCESDCLKIKVDVVMVLPIGKIIAPTEEEVDSSKELHQM